jgi:hypothetical protein
MRLWRISCQTNSRPGIPQSYLLAWLEPGDRDLLAWLETRHAAISLLARLETGGDHLQMQ